MFAMQRHDLLRGNFALFALVLICLPGLLHSLQNYVLIFFLKNLVSSLVLSYILPDDNYKIKCSQEFSSVFFLK